MNKKISKIQDNVLGIVFFAKSSEIKDKWNPTTKGNKIISIFLMDDKNYFKK